MRHHTLAVRRRGDPRSDRCSLHLESAPIAAQGANLGSRCAFLLGELITTSLSYDQQFCLEVERKMGELALAPTALSLAMLEPPGPGLNHLLARAATDSAVADRFADGFAHPDALVASLNPAAA
jgi:hypothetical protein